MRCPLPVALAAFLLLVSPGRTSRPSQHPPGKDAILLSDVHSLTLRANSLTRARRVAPVPQLSCTGPSKKICGLYQIETMRCTNEGYDYDEEDVQWTCTASLPPEFKLGATDVVCEGYRSADDKWVLKGSCGVEYRLLPTERGEERFGKVREQTSWFPQAGAAYGGYRKAAALVGDLIFFGFMVAVCLWILVPMLADCFGLRRNRRGATAGRGWGGFWGGGGGGGGGGGDDESYPGPPPPYSSSCADGSDYAAWGRPFWQGWTPGFWTGALGGAAAGYQMGRRAGNGSGAAFLPRRGTPLSRYDDDDPGEGSSRSRSPPRFSNTTTSTGFGSTRRR